MIKKISAIFLLFFLPGCVLLWNNAPEGYKQCPLITIKREDARLIQIVNYKDNFMVELKGTEAFCYFDDRVKQEKAVITPIFEVKRLQQSDENDVQFAWFTNTIKGPPAFLGKKTYFEAVSLSADENEKEFKGKAVEVKIPQEMMYEFEIFAGLVISPQGKAYNQRFFDVDMEYDDAASETKIYETKIKEYPPLYNQDGTFAE